jgi:class 3 adenylate cyclase
MLAHLPALPVGGSGRLKHGRRRHREGAKVAARLCGEAADGQILIPARLHGMVETLVEAEPIGDLALKGFQRPVTAFNITGLHDDEPTEGGGTA